MRRFLTVIVALVLLAGSARGGERQAQPAPKGEAGPAVTIYNQMFAVVRDTLRLELKAGVNRVQYDRMTRHVETDTVMLRDPAGAHAIQILEQNYRADPVSQALLLNHFEGEEIVFEVRYQDRVERVKGRIVRSGYQPHQQGLRRYGHQYRARQMTHAYGGGGQPLVEINGRLRFGLPGIPLFPSLGEESILKPTIHWQIETPAAAAFDAELAYVTGGMTWEADYNLVAPETSDTSAMTGWVTIDNQSGKTFEHARIKLMAGDVHKIQPGREFDQSRLMGFAKESRNNMAPPVSEKAFDEFHLYTLNRRTTLRDRETKQVEFVRADEVTAKKLLVYDGAAIDWRRYRGWNRQQLRQDQSFGTECNPKVWIMREIENTAANGLGIPLPRGIMRFYRRDADGQLEFVGENWIDHTPKDETFRVYTGNAFDVVGERTRTDFKADYDDDWIDESFAIKVRNHKAKPATVRVVEHLFRWVNWTITEKTHDYKKVDADTVEWTVTIPRDGEAVIRYKVHYDW